MSAQPTHIRVVDDRDAAEIPPCDIAAEALVVGALLWSNCASALALFRDILRPEHFYSEAHRLIFAAACSVADTTGADSVDLATVQAALTERKKLTQVGGRRYLDEVRRDVPASGSNRHREWASAVYNAWRLRQAIALSQRTAAQGYLGVESTQEFLEAFARKATWLSNADVGRLEETTAQTVNRVVSEIEAAHAGREGESPIVGMGARTGLPRLDKTIHGIRPGKNYVLCAGTGVGKTALAMQMAVHVASHGLGVAFVVAEPSMKREDHAKRLLAHLAWVDATKIANPKSLETQELKSLAEAKKKIAALPLQLHDARGCNVDHVVSDVRRYAETFKAIYRVPLGMVVVDYVQRLAPSNACKSDEKHRQMEYATNRLAELGAELNVAMLQLSQRKPPDPRAKNKKPTTDCTADSKEIGKSADVLMVIAEDGDPDPKWGEQDMTLHLPKNRGGKKGDGVEIGLIFRGGYLHFEERAS